MIAGMFGAGTGHNDPVCGEFAAVNGRLQGHSHLAPFIERAWTAEFDATFVDGDGIG